MTPAARGKRVFDDTCVRDEEGACANDRLPVDTADALASGFLRADFAGYLRGGSTTCTEMSGVVSRLARCGVLPGQPFAGSHRADSRRYPGTQRWRMGEWHSPLSQRVTCG